MDKHKSWKRINPKHSEIKSSFHTQKRKAIFLDRDGVINIERSYIKTPEDFELYEFTPGAIKKINQSDYLAIVITNQSMIAQNMCTLDELENIHRKLDSELERHGAYIDAIYFCPHHPEQINLEENADLRIDCECRKPKPGMFLTAAQDFNIDLKKSFMIGDTERDIIAGSVAGCRTIGVLTGYGLKGSTIRPDYMFDNLEKAIDYLF